MSAHLKSIACDGPALVDLIVDDRRAVLLKNIAVNLPDITLNERHLCDLELLATGGFSPLGGFMARADYEPVLDRMRLQDGTLWPLPICLDVSAIKAQRLEAGQSAALRDAEGLLIAVIRAGSCPATVCSFIRNPCVLAWKAIS